MYLCCGDSLFDLFAHAATGDDASASRVTLSGDAGGSPMNVAVGLARLGHHSRFFTKLSSDMFGQRLRGYLERNNTDTSLCIDTDLNTTLAIVEKQPDGSADYAFQISTTADISLEATDLPAQLPNDLRVIHFGSYSTVVLPGAATLLKFAQRETSSRVISYDPNLRTSIEPDIDLWRKNFKAFASTANLIKASDEDIAELLGTGQEQNFVADCFANGAQLVYITRGGEGASGFKADGTSAHHKGVKVNVVDTVGAGDTFQASILHWLQTHNHITDAATIVGDVDINASMDFAIRAAAITCTRSGADLPYLKDLA